MRHVTCSLLVLLAVGGASLSSRGVQRAVPRPQPGDRMQLNVWTDTKLGVSDPLTQIVRIERDGNSGTGFTLSNCRIMTAAHVVGGGASGTIHEGDLVGERFPYFTAPLPSLGGRRGTGEFVVTGHGVIAGKNVGVGRFSRDDWAVGYDENCLADKLKLGTLDIGWTVSLSRPVNVGDSPADRQNAELNVSGRQLFTAGYSLVTMPGLPADTWPLYVDSGCKVRGETAADASANRAAFSVFRTVITDCVLYPGGSGQPLLSPVIADGRLVRTADGRPKLEALGLFQSGNDDLHILMVFNQEALRELRDLLDTPMTGAALNALRVAAAKRDVDRRAAIAIRQRLKDDRWAPFASSAVDGNLRACRAASGEGAVNACTDVLQLPEAPKVSVVQALKLRASARVVAKEYGQAVRDVDLAFEVVASMPASEAAGTRQEELYAVRGDVYHATELFTESREQFDKAVALLPTDPSRLSAAERERHAALLEKRAHISDEHLRDYLGALIDYERIVTLTPSDPAALNNRCYAYASVSHLPAAPPDALGRALADCNKALALKPGEANILDSRGFVYLKMGRTDDAIRDYDAALAIQPRLASALYARGRAKTWRGDLAGGQADMNAASAIDSNIWYPLGNRGLRSTPPQPAPPGPTANPAVTTDSAAAITKLVRSLEGHLKGPSILVLPERHTWTLIEYRAGTLRMTATIDRAPQSGVPASKVTKTYEVAPETLVTNLETPPISATAGTYVTLQCLPTPSAPDGALCIHEELAGLVVGGRSKQMSVATPAKSAAEVAALLTRIISAAKGGAK